MIIHRAAWSALLVCLAVPDVAAQTCDSSPLLVRNANLWTRDGSVARRDVLFREGRVAAIEPAGSRQHDGTRTIDGTGHTLLPGLVDAHLHFSIPGGLPAGNGPRTDVEHVTARQLVRSGVTSGRLHLATLDEAVRLKGRGADACVPIPRLQVGGPGLSGAVDRDFGNFQGAKSRDDATAKIERFRAAGVDWVAIHDADRFPADVLSAIASAARRTGLRLFAAGSTPLEILAALSLNPDTLDYFDRTDAPTYATAVLDAIRAHRNLVLVPTPGVPYRAGEYARNSARLEEAGNFTFLDAADRAFVLASAKKDLVGADAARAERVRASLPAKFQQLRQQGLPMAIGSDAGSPLQFQAGAIWWELEAWRSLGASHREALVAATEHGARVLRAEDIGRLAVGSRADFVLYRGDVEQGPFDVARVLAVGKGGVLYVTEGEWTGPELERRN